MHYNNVNASPPEIDIDIAILTTKLDIELCIHHLFLIAACIYQNIVVEALFGLIISMIRYAEVIRVIIFRISLLIN